MNTTVMIVGIVALVLIVYLLRDRITSLYVNWTKGTMQVKAKPTESIQAWSPEQCVQVAT